MRREVEKVKVHDDILEYMTDLAEASRTHELVYLGISPRAVSYTHLDVYKRQILRIVVHGDCF